VTLEQVRAVHTVTELVHAIAYLCPDVEAEFEALGLEPRGQGYVAGRAAPLGPVGPELTTATFYNFSPNLHRHALPAAWGIAAPEQVLAARFRGIQAVYERVEARTGGLDELTDLALRAADGLPLAGRPLAAANAAVALPEQPFARAWQALAVLREFRGDGHIAVLLVAELGPVEALAMYAAWQRHVSERFLKATRGWDESAWTAAEDALRDRGWMADDGTLTEEGQRERDAVEEATDRLAAAPYERLGRDDTARLFELARPLAQALNDNGGYRRPAPMPDAFPG
jgi:hypothetical protein